MATEFKGKAKVLEAVQYNADNKHAVFVEIIVADETGKRFTFPVAAFLFDLKPVEGA